MDQEMTVEHRPEHNGRTASGRAYDKPQRFGVRRRVARRRGIGLLRLVAPALLGLALVIVIRSIAEAPEA